MAEISHAEQKKRYDIHDIPGGNLRGDEDAVHGNWLCLPDRGSADDGIQGGVQGLFPVSNVDKHIQLDLRQKQCLVEAVVEQAAGRFGYFPAAAAPVANGSAAEPEIR